MNGYRFFDHTGDFGADLSAETREGIYESAARALVALVTDAPESVRELERRELALEGVDGEDLLVALGNELLYLFEEGWIAARVEVCELGERSLRVIAHGEPFDPERHPIARPVKAVTHHAARLTPTEDGYRARLVFDL
jgi:SHS2 domain-containing protein